MNDLMVGQVVRSKAGRDKGQFMVVLSIIDDNYVYVSNGQLRKVSRPKKKKIKHLSKTNHITMIIRNKMENSQEITNSDIKREIQSFLEPEGLEDEYREEV
ncbi:KOW domain-containing RNA-binding protein [Eubacteriaceae bacterium ES2]|nr:KOW domain-containing RNA-binding protein [Eubacteriaceae bacterium ES2]